MKSKIRELLKHELTEGELKRSPFRQSYHLMADVGWISDPNGLCQLGDTYHIFHQYTPDESRKLWKSWGHYTTKDWIHFQDQGTLMVPDEAADKDGCYSGSGFVHDGLMHLFYTGNSLQDGDFDYINAGRGHYTRHLQSEDGVHFSSRETLLTNEDYPETMSCHVRDPKVDWTDGHLFMTLGARTKASEGCALLYECDPDRPTSVRYIQTIRPEHPMGYMWECPDLMRLDGHLLLLCCPQGLEQEEYRYENIYQNGWFDLVRDRDGRLSAGAFHELDHGFDFYAPQTMLDSRGRRILLGWMGMPDAAYEYPEKADGWTHCLTLPRELHWRNGRIWQYPISETEQLRTESRSVHLEPDHPMTLNSPAFELHLNTEDRPFCLRLRADAEISWNGHLLELSLKDSGRGRTVRHLECSGVESLDIFSDTSSLEIFVNHGEYALSTRVYDAGQPLILSSTSTMDGTLYSLRPTVTDYSPALADEDPKAEPAG